MAVWHTFDTTSAPNPKKGEPPLTLAVSKEFAQTHADIHRVTPIYQMWAHVLGKLPPINNISKVANGTPAVSLTTLHDAVACFGGIQRPHDDEANGESVLVYVLTPTISIEYAPSMVCMAQAFKVPSNTVLTVHVRPNFTLQQGNGGVHGFVTRIEPVFSTSQNPGLPAKFDSRYGERFW